MAFEKQQFLFLSKIHDICQADDDDICVIQINGLVTILNLEKNAIFREFDLEGNILRRFGTPLGVLNKKLIFAKQIIDIQSKCVVSNFKDYRISIANKQLYVFRQIPQYDHKILQIGGISQQDFAFINLKQYKFYAWGIQEIILKKYTVFILNQKRMRFRNINGKENLYFIREFYQRCSIFQGFKQNQIIIQIIQKGIVYHQTCQKIIRKISINGIQSIVTDGKRIINKRKKKNSNQYKISVLDIILLKQDSIFSGQDMSDLYLTQNSKFVFWRKKDTIWSLKLSD